MVFGCAMNTATYGTGSADAGVASALVNTNQQVGGSIGTALLNTIAASALTSYVLAHGHSPLVQAEAAVHSYVVAFWVSAAILAGAGARGRHRRSPDRGHLVSPTAAAAAEANSCRRADLAVIHPRCSHSRPASESPAITTSPNGMER